MGVCSASKTKKENGKDDGDGKDAKGKKNAKNKDKKEDEEIPEIKEINVKFTEKGEEKFSATFNTTELVEVLFNKLVQEAKSDSEYDLITCNNTSLTYHLKEKLFRVFPGKTDIELSLLFLGLEIPTDIEKEYKQLNQKISTPLLDLGDKIGIAIYDNFSQKFTQSILNDDNLSKFNHLSSYCNGMNYLFICGGEGKNTNEYINDFYSINLNNLEEVNELENLNEGRAWHSMIFIPPNYIFIVSGSVKSVELYDIKKKVITIDSELNDIRGECTLCCVNTGTLYAFCGFLVNDSFLNTIEGCKLKKRKRVWNYVNYTTSDNILFEQCYYICSYFSENSIILFGSTENLGITNKNIVFNFEDEESPVTSRYENAGDTPIKDICPEKFFHPIGNSNYILIPLTGSIVKVYFIDENRNLTLKEFPNVLNEILG